MRSRFTFLIVFLLSGLLAVGGSLVAEPAGQISTPPPGITCDQLVLLAETSVALVCNGIGRNQACYGNRLVSVEFQPDSTLSFRQSGDTVDLLAVRRLSTSPLNVLTQNWGIAVLKAQANLPDALPGQNVTFLLYGDTTVDNPSPGMNAVTVNTRIGSTSCTDVPDSAVLIQSPTGSPVAMNINGADVTLGSTAFVTAQLGGELTFAVVEGTGVVASNGVIQTVLPGAQVRIPLGGEDGLHANGAPSEPEPFNLDVIQFAPFRLLERSVTIPLPFQPGQTVPTSDKPTATLPVNQTPEVTACVPRTDWAFRYVIQPNENLYDIAAKLNMNVNDLLEGNCLDDPIRIIAGRSIQVPRPVATRTPTTAPAVATATATQLSSAFTGPDLRADANPILYGECTHIRWDLENIDSVFFEGSPTVGHGAQEVCPGETTTYTLRVVALDQSSTSFQITITVEYGGYEIDPGS